MRVTTFCDTRSNIACNIASKVAVSEAGIMIMACNQLAQAAFL